VARRKKRQHVKWIGIEKKIGAENEITRQLNMSCNITKRPKLSTFITSLLQVFNYRRIQVNTGRARKAAPAKAEKGIAGSVYA
jgi:hypothetical protein